MDITLTNDFHNTSVTLRLRADGTLTDGQVRRAKRELCGMADCSCSSDIGIRGPQMEHPQHAELRLVVDDVHTGREGCYEALWYDRLTQEYYSLDYDL